MNIVAVWMLERVCGSCVKPNMAMLGFTQKPHTLSSIHTATIFMT